MTTKDEVKALWKLCFTDSDEFTDLYFDLRYKDDINMAVREDGKIDLELQKRGVKKVDDFAELLLQYIKDNDGYTPINDKTDAEQIYNTFGVSKKTFKKAVGDLYKKRLIVLEDDGIRLVKE